MTEEKKQEQKQKTPREVAADELRKMWSEKTREELIQSYLDTLDELAALRKKVKEGNDRIAFLEETTRNQYGAYAAKDDVLREAKAMADFWRRYCDMYRAIFLAKRWERMVNDEGFQKFCEALMKDGPSMKTIEDLEASDPSMSKYGDEVRAAIAAEKAINVLEMEKNLGAAKNWLPE